MKKILCVLTIAPWLLFAENEMPTLSVSGEGKTILKATIADLRLGVEAEGKTALEVQQTLLRQVQPVIEELRKMNPDKLETDDFNIYPEYTKSNPPQIAGYRGKADVLLSAQASKIGPLLDAALKAGANQIRGITLRPSDGDLQAARQESLRKACTNALIEANTVMQALGIQANRIKQVEINPSSNSYLRPMARSYMVEAAPASLEVTEQEQTVTANIHLIFDLKAGNSLEGK